MFKERRVRIWMFVGEFHGGQAGSGVESQGRRLAGLPLSPRLESSPWGANQVRGTQMEGPERHVFSWHLNYSPAPREMMGSGSVYPALTCNCGWVFKEPMRLRPCLPPHSIFSQPGQNPLIPSVWFLPAQAAASVGGTGYFKHLYNLSFRGLGNSPRLPEQEGVELWFEPKQSDPRADLALTAMSWALVTCT